MGKLAIWKSEISAHKYSIILSIILILFANYLNFLAGKFADNKGSNNVSDLILDSLPAIDLSLIFTYGFTLIVAIFILYPVIFKPRLFHVFLSQLSLLLLVRSFFVTLTHLKHPADAILSNFPEIYAAITPNNSLFFSGHVAVSFLCFLMLKDENKFLKYFFLISTTVMAVTVLLMHVHYSIDVFAAFFITYGVYNLGKRFFEEK